MVSTLAPSCTKASVRSEIGRSLIRGVPSISTGPLTSGAMAVMNRAVVPDAPTSILLVGTPNSPPVPNTSHGSATSSIITPSCCNAVRMTTVSSASRAPWRREAPDFASAARIRARFVALFDPGGLTTASIGASTGEAVYVSMRAGLVTMTVTVVPGSEAAGQSVSAESDRAESDSAGALAASAIL